MSFSPNYLEKIQVQ